MAGINCCCLLRFFKGNWHGICVYNCGVRFPLIRNHLAPTGSGIYQCLTAIVAPENNSLTNSQLVACMTDTFRIPALQPPSMTTLQSFY